jgi:hypothetical protein
LNLYRASNFGFIHGPGRYLWNPAGRPLALYFIEIPAFWMASTAFLVTAGFVQAWSYVSEGRLTRTGELILTCAIVHLAFIFIFFGSASSWIYYSNVLVIGCALATEMGPRWRLIAIPLCVLALLSQLSPAAVVVNAWKTTSPSPATAGLWATPDEVSEWNKVLGLARQEKTVVIEVHGSVELMYPEFGKPVSLFLDTGLATDADVARKTAQIATASAFVVPQTVRTYGGLPDAPEITATMRNFDLEWKGSFFEVYRRRGGTPAAAH